MKPRHYKHPSNPLYSGSAITLKPFLQINFTETGKIVGIAKNVGSG